MNGLRDTLLGNETLVDEFAAEFKRELTRLRKERRGAGRRLVRTFNRSSAALNACLDFITGGDGALVVCAISYGIWRLATTRFVPI